MEKRSKGRHNGGKRRKNGGACFFVGEILFFVGNAFISGGKTLKKRSASKRRQNATMKWLGFVIGGGLSFWTHGSVPWAMFHFCLSWIYVLYHLMVYELGVFRSLELTTVLGIFR